MTLFDSLAARFGYTKASPAAPAWALASADQARWSMPSLYGAYNQEDLYRKLSWVQIAVSLIASSCAGVPMGVLKRAGEDKKPVGNHPLELLLQSPNELDSDHDEFMEASFAYYLLTGNAYWWVNATTPTSPPDELWIVPPEKLEPIPDGRQYIKEYRYIDGAYEAKIPVTDIIHFKRFNPLNRFVGLSPIGAISSTAVGDLAMSAWNAEFFAKNNAKPAGALTFTNEPVDWERFKAELRNEHGGTARNLLMMKNIPKDGMQWVQFGIPQKDMEFLAGRQFNREEIFQLYGVPMGLVSENATEANATVADAGFNKRVLWPLLTRFAGKVTSKLLPRYGQGLVAEYEDIRVTDRQMELEERKTWSLYRTVDELREADDLEPIGDARGEKLVTQITPELAAQPIAGETDGTVQPVETNVGDATPDNLASVQGLNGAQITAALQIVDEVSQGITPLEVARELFAALGIEEDRVTRMVASLKPGSVPREQNNTQPDKGGELSTASVKAQTYTADLRLWRKKSLRMFALKGTGVCGFTSDGIPSETRNRVAYGLAGAGDVGAVKAVFDGEIKAVEGEQSAEIIELASAIRRAAATVGTEL